MELILQQKFEKLVAGHTSFSSHNLGFNLLVSRLQKKYASNQSPTEMKSCILEIDVFCTKYKSIMAAELETIKKL